MTSPEGQGACPAVEGGPPPRGEAPAGPPPQTGQGVGLPGVGVEPLDGGDGKTTLITRAGRVQEPPRRLRGPPAGIGSARRSHLLARLGVDLAGVGVGLLLLLAPR